MFTPSEILTIIRAVQIILEMLGLSREDCVDLITKASEEDSSDVSSEVKL